MSSEEEEMGPEQLAAYRAELAQFVQDNEEAIRREQEKRREKVYSEIKGTKSPDLRLQFHIGESIKIASKYKFKYK